MAELDNDVKRLYAEVSKLSNLVQSQNTRIEKIENYIVELEKQFTEYAKVINQAARQIK